MSWLEIGVALGYKPRKGDARYPAKVAFMFYSNAMKKIRKRMPAIAKLRELVEFRDSQRREQVLPDWSGIE